MDAPLLLRKTSASRPSDERAVRPVIASNGVLSLQMRSVGLCCHLTVNFKSLGDRSGYFAGARSLPCMLAYYPTKCKTFPSQFSILRIACFQSSDISSGPDEDNRELVVNADIRDLAFHSSSLQGYRTGIDRACSQNGESFIMRKCMICTVHLEVSFRITCG